MGRAPVGGYGGGIYIFVRLEKTVVCGRFQIQVSLIGAVFEKGRGARYEACASCQRSTPVIQSRLRAAFRDAERASDGPEEAPPIGRDYRI